MTCVYVLLVVCVYVCMCVYVYVVMMVVVVVVVLCVVVAGGSTGYSGLGLDDNRFSRFLVRDATKSCSNMPKLRLFGCEGGSKHSSFYHTHWCANSKLLCDGNLIFL